MIDRIQIQVDLNLWFLFVLLYLLFIDEFIKQRLSTYYVLATVKSTENTPVEKYTSSSCFQIFYILKKKRKYIHMSHSDECYGKKALALYMFKLFYWVHEYLLLIHSGELTFISIC